jgi:hypothetical protein
VQENLYVADPETLAEMARLLDQDLLVTRRVSGLLPPDVLPEQILDVLDVGCGPGGWVREVARVYPHLAVTGIDNSALVIEYAAARARVDGLTNAHFTTYTQAVSHQGGAGAGSGDYRFFIARFSGLYRPPHYQQYTDRSYPIIQHVQQDAGPDRGGAPAHEAEQQADYQQHGERTGVNVGDGEQQGAQDDGQRGGHAVAQARQDEPPEEYLFTERCDEDGYQQRGVGGERRLLAAGQDHLVVGLQIEMEGCDDGRIQDVDGEDEHHAADDPEGSPPYRE